VAGDIRKYIIRLLLLLVIQVIILLNAFQDTEIGRYINIFLYVIFILLFPVNTRTVFLLFISFVLGLLVDLFYQTPGIHASALLVVAMLRNTVLYFIAPREKYDSNAIPSVKRYGWQWYIQYIGIMSFVFCSYYAVVESFTVANLHIVLLRAFLSTVATVICMCLYTMLAIQE